MWCLNALLKLDLWVRYEIQHKDTLFSQKVLTPWKLNFICLTSMLNMIKFKESFIYLKRKWDIGNKIKFHLPCLEHSPHHQSSLSRSPPNKQACTTQSFQGGPYQKHCLCIFSWRQGYAWLVFLLFFLLDECFMLCRDLSTFLQSWEEKHKFNLLW